MTAANGGEGSNIDRPVEILMRIVEDLPLPSESSDGRLEGHESHDSDTIVSNANVDNSDQPNSNPGAAHTDTYRADSEKLPDRVYNVLIYASEELPDELPLHWVEPHELPSNIANSYNGWRIRAVERVRISQDHSSRDSSSLLFHIWDDDRYFAWFRWGLKSNRDGSSRLGEALSSGLRELFGRENQTSLKVWWDCTSFALAELPWELTAYGNPKNPLIFFRGAPPLDGHPPVEFFGKLRLAIVGQHEDGRWNSTTWRSLRNHPDLEVLIWDDLTPVEALSKAATEGIELVHLFAGGKLTEIYEGTLRLRAHGSKEYTNNISVRELEELLCHSRVAVLSLTHHLELDSAWLEEVTIVKAEQNHLWVEPYRTFAALGTTPYSLPTIVASLGPLDDFTKPTRSASFWVEFYSTLASTGDLGAAVIAGQRKAEGFAPIAVFPRGRDTIVARQLGLEEVVARATNTGAEGVSYLNLHLPPELLSETENNGQSYDPSLVATIQAALLQSHIRTQRASILNDLISDIERIDDPQGVLKELNNELRDQLMPQAQE